MQHIATVHVASTDMLPMAERFSYWADVVAQTFVPLECDTPARRDFSGSIRHRQIGCIGITDVRASAQRVRRTRAKIACAPSDDLIVVVHVDGLCNVGQKENAALLQPGDGAIVTAKEVYSFDFPAPFRQLVLKVPRSLVRYARTDEIDLGFRLASGPTHFLRHLALASLDESKALSETEEVGTERAFAELLASAALPPARRATQDDAATRYASALTFIRRNLADPNLSPTAVAAHIGLSQRSLARLFALRGETIERSIWSIRLAEAKNDLADPRLKERSITDIAFSWGFNDAAHFSRSFFNAYGMTPKQFRTNSNTGPVSAVSSVPIA